MKSIRRKITTALAPGMVLACLWHPAVHGQSTTREDTPTSATPQTGGSSPQTVAFDFVQHAMEINQAQRATARLAMRQASTDAVKGYARRMLEAHVQAEQELESLQARTTPAAATRPPSGRDNGQTPEKGRTEERTASEASGNTGIENVDSRTDTTGSESGLGIPATPALGSRMGRTDLEGDQAPGMPSEAYDEDHSRLAEKHQVSINRLKPLSGLAYDREYMAVQEKNHRDAIQLYERQVDNGDNARLKQYVRQQLPVLREHLREATSIRKMLGGSK